MSKPKPIKTVSELQTKMDAEIDKVDRKIAKLNKEHEKVMAQCEKEKKQIETKYPAMIDQLEIDIPFSQADINTNNFGDHS